MKSVRIALCGIGGYGATYLQCLLNEDEVRGCRLIAAIDPNIGQSPSRGALEARGVKSFTRLEDFYRDNSCDLLVISSPIHFHFEHVCAALTQGSHVLCEKPICVTQHEVEKISQLQQHFGKIVTVGYQWSFDPGIQQLKDDLLRGRFGSPVRLRTLVCWPRDSAYYQRNGWAGSLRDPDGRWILDSPVSNAAGHFLHNMLYILGESREQSARPVKVVSHLFRANPISNYDTAAIRITTDNGADVQFYTSHATQHLTGPEFIYEFEKATIFYSEVKSEMKAVLSNAKVIHYPFPEVDSFNKLWSAVDAARNGEKSLCGIEAAKSHVRSIELAQQSSEGILTFPDSMITVDRTKLSPIIYVKGLQEALTQCYEEGTPENLLKFAERPVKDYAYALANKS